MGVAEGDVRCRNNDMPEVPYVQRLLPPTTMRLCGIEMRSASAGGGFTTSCLPIRVGAGLLLPNVLLPYLVTFVIVLGTRYAITGYWSRKGRKKRSDGLGVPSWAQEFFCLVSV